MDRLLDKIPLPRSAFDRRLPVSLKASGAAGLEAFAGPPDAADQWTSFQNSRFINQASQVNTNRNNTTQTPSECRLIWVGSPT